MLFICEFRNFAVAYSGEDLGIRVREGQEPIPARQRYKKKEGVQASSVANGRTQDNWPDLHQ